MGLGVTAGCAGMAAGAEHCGGGTGMAACGGSTPFPYTFECGTEGTPRGGRGIGTGGVAHACGVYVGHGANGGGAGEVARAFLAICCARSFAPFRFTGLGGGGLLKGGCELPLPLLFPKRRFPPPKFEAVVLPYA